MTDTEYYQLEKRINERNRIEAMCADLKASKQESAGARQAETIRCKQRGEKPYFTGSEISLGSKNKTAGGSFQQTQGQTENWS